MRKLIVMMSTMLLVAGFFSMSAFAATVDPDTMDGQCAQCEGTAVLGQDAPVPQGNIARGCEGEQSSTSCFDYEHSGYYCGDGSYCTNSAKAYHKAMFEICSCLDTWGESLRAGDTLDIAMEILVEKDGILYDGDNGVYWCSNVASIGVNFATDYDTHCDNLACEPNQDRFEGPFILDSKKLRITPDFAVAGHGAKVPALGNLSQLWAWFDVPAMIVDPDEVEAGQRVWVKVCMYHNAITPEDLPYCSECCCLISIGELCCEGAGASGECVYPYFTKANSTYWAFTGFALDNLSSVAGTATLTVYEQDGDVGTMEVPLAANGMYTNTLAGMTFTQTSGSGTLGDSPFYMVAKANVTIHGFVMMGNPATGETAAYIPDCCGICSY